MTSPYDIGLKLLSTFGIYTPEGRENSQILTSVWTGERSDIGQMQYKKSKSFPALLSYSFLKLQFLILNIFGQKLRFRENN